MITTSTISDVISELVPLQGQSVLDVGSGTGGLMRSLMAAGAEVQGIEPNAANVGIARQTDPDRRANYHVAGAEGMPFDGTEFDVVIFSNSLHHVPVTLMSAALKESARVLKPGGRAIIAEPVPAGAHFNLSLPMEDETDVRNQALANILDQDNHGLAVVKETSFIRATPYTNFESYHKAMIQVDPAREQAFVDRGDDLRANFGQYARREDGLSIFDQEIRVHILQKAV